MNAVTLPSVLDDVRVGELLSLWERWMQPGPGATLELGYALQCKAFMSPPAGYWEDTFDQEIEEMDSRIASKVNAAIEDLDVPYQQAIYTRHLAAVFRWRRGCADDYYDRARVLLSQMLPMRGVY